MGTGICGVIPIELSFYGYRTSEQQAAENEKRFRKHAAEDFFDFYNKKSEDGKAVYIIKPEILLPNFKDFFFDFHKLIDNEENIEWNLDKFNEEYDAVVASNNLDAFMEHFSKNEYTMLVHFPYFEPMYFNCNRNLLIYFGSYKAILEEWSTLYHLERILRAAMSNPLAKVMSIGMSG